MHVLSELKHTVLSNNRWWCTRGGQVVYTVVCKRIQELVIILCVLINRIYK